MFEQSFMAEGTYGGPTVARHAPPAATPDVAQPNRERVGTDPHDKSIGGPDSLLDDPTFWLVLVAGAATGLIGFKFAWGRGGVSASVDLGDELAFWLAVPLASIAGIVLFKVAASKIENRGLQELAAAI